MDRVYQSNAVETPPEPISPSGSYPTAGDKVTGQVATVPGAYWFYSVTEELRNAIIAAGVTPNQNEVDQLAQALSKTVPVGTVITMSANEAPSGYLFCNGSEVSRTTYADLFAKIGTLYGEGDGSTTFNIPELRGRFIQGGAAGTVKNAGLPNITGSIVAESNSNVQMLLDGNYTESGALYISGKISRKTISNGDAYQSPKDLCFDASRSNSIYGNSTTVQPPALTMRFYIKY